jgi:hypothetical protein
VVRFDDNGRQWLLRFLVNFASGAIRSRSEERFVPRKQETDIVLVDIHYRHRRRESAEWSSDTDEHQIHTFVAALTSEPNGAM